jgi:RimJ/RimL family protein N-acetyltransferase
MADADFILRLRSNPELNQNISATPSSLEAQKNWILDYQKRFEMGQEAYFIIRCDGEDVGTLRIYDYDQSNNSFCWGSWLIKPGTSPCAAFLSMILVYELCFDSLGFALARFEVRQANKSVWSFHERIGATLIAQNTLNRFYEMTPSNFLKAKVLLQKFASLLK